MSAQEMDAEKAFERFESMLRDWLRDSGGARRGIRSPTTHRPRVVTTLLAV